MYHSQKSYTDRVRMRQEWNKLLFLLYFTIIVSIVRDIITSHNVVLSTTYYNVIYSAVQVSPLAKNELWNIY